MVDKAIMGEKDYVYLKVIVLPKKGYQRNGENYLMRSSLFVLFTSIGEGIKSRRIRWAGCDMHVEECWLQDPRRDTFGSPRFR